MTESGLAARYFNPGDCFDRRASLRANGSRECAPDDRLRETIQNVLDANGLLRRFAPLRKRFAFVAGNGDFAIQPKAIALWPIPTMPAGAMNTSSAHPTL